MMDKNKQSHPINSSLMAFLITSKCSVETRKVSRSCGHSLITVASSFKGGSCNRTTQIPSLLSVFYKVIHFYFSGPRDKVKYITYSSTFLISYSYELQLTLVHMLHWKNQLLTLYLILIEIV